MPSCFKPNRARVPRATVAMAEVELAFSRELDDDSNEVEDAGDACDDDDDADAAAKA